MEIFKHTRAKSDFEKVVVKEKEERHGCLEAL